MATAQAMNPVKGRRALGLLDTIAIGVNAIVGSGVFSIPDDMSREMGAWSPLAFLFCALILAPVALCFAELSGRATETGGPYLYAHQAFGPAVGFSVGWLSWLNSFISWAANASLFVVLCGAPEGSIVGTAGCVATIVVLAIINILGVRIGAFVIRLMVIGKLGAILCFLVAAFMRFDGERFGSVASLTTLGVGNGIYLALFPLQGFEVVPVTAGETDNPRRNVPVGTLLSLGFASLLYVVVQTALVGSYAPLASESMTPLVDAAKQFGPLLGILVLTGSVVSVGGFTAGSALGSPRYALAMAEQKQLPSFLMRLHPRFATPHFAIIATGLITIFFATAYDYRKLVGISNVSVVIQYAVTCIAVPVYRARLGKPEGWAVPLGPVLPILGAVGSLALLLGASMEELLVSGAALGAGCVGALIFTVVGRRKPPVTT